jgi:hypothetical protein
VPERMLVSTIVTLHRTTWGSLVVSRPWSAFAGMVAHKARGIGVCDRQGEARVSTVCIALVVSTKLLDCQVSKTHCTVTGEEDGEEEVT